MGCTLNILKPSILPNLDIYFCSNNVHENGNMISQPVIHPM